MDKLIRFRLSEKQASELEDTAKFEDRSVAGYLRHKLIKDGVISDHKRAEDKTGWAGKYAVDPDMPEL
jgi:hypothetical protein